MTKNKQSEWATKLLPIASLILCLPFFKWQTGLVLLIALVPYLIYLKIKFKQGDSSGVLLATWLLGFFYLLLVCSWLIVADAKSWTQLGGVSLQYLVFLMWFLLCLALSFGFLFMGYVVYAAIKRQVRYEKFLLLFPFLWVACEFGRSLLFSVLSYGDGASIGPYYNFGALGYGLAGTPLLHLSRSVGLFGLSFLVVAVNVCIVLALARKWRYVLYFLLPICLVGVITVVWRPTADKSVRVTTVQLASTDTMYYNQLADNLTEESKNSDILALPEYSYFFSYGSESQHSSVTKKVFSNNQGVLLYSQRGPMKNGRQTNQLVAARPDGQIVSAQIKSFIIPTGEYIPWAVLWGLKLAGQSKVESYFNTSVGVTSGDIHEKPIVTDKVTIGALACSGVIAADRYAALTRAGSEVLTNSASLNEFSNAPVYYEQARQFARFIAVANDRPFVQSARGGFAYIIDQDGHFLYDSHSPGLKVGSKSVTITHARTYYTRFGEWVVYVSFAVVIICLTYLLKKPRSN